MTIPGIPSPALPYNSTVVVTGCSGFIGSHVADQTLSAGFKVRGVSRDARKNQWLKDYFDARHGAGKFELVSVPDLAADNAFVEVVKGASGFIHVAHDMSGAGDPCIAIPQSVNMALSALKTAAAAGLTRFVYTSSSFAVTQPKPNVAFSVCESTFNQEAVDAVAAKGAAAGGATVYSASKVAVERAMSAWKTESGASIVVNCVNPNGNLGPVLQPQHQGYPTTASWVKSLFAGEYEKLNRAPEHFIDVRDDAKLHVIALAHPGLQGRRLLGLVAPAPISRIVKILRGEFPERGFEDFEDDGVDRITNLMRDEVEGLLREAYGHEYTPLEESVRANARGLE
ncbi:aldehyde reductase [Didymella exigua CBS 183.55]|uniref:Aldehyde reductase n=1 Tax=Didymella exigua CBS 183.55 TaxID=1150837 RepID=A0A6A5R856_9PLEO|nr:aldehyde reductase [Didymella exigua CBS 183.55]KAF1923803.1 aldehyde reductase [Didymella exigua CBS 183.55]